MSKKIKTRKKSTNKKIGAFYLVSLCLSLFILGCLLVPPHKFWIAGLITFAIPLVIFYNLVFSVISIFKNRSRIIYFIIPLIVSTPVIITNYGFFPKCDKTKDSFKVVSYNVQLLDYYQKFAKDERYKIFISELKSFIKERNADVYCFQEFYSEEKGLNYLDSFLPGYHRVFTSDSSNIYLKRRGVVIFSKYPIIEHGILDFNTGTHNRGIYIKTKINNDTIRFINVHLQSMSLKKLHPRNNNLSDAFENIIEIFRRLKSGYIERSYQLNQLFKFIESDSAPTILTGDFNQQPFSYLYFKLSRTMNDAFRKAGNGFGITYNGSTLFFLRIDYQFYSDKIEINCFKTHHSASFFDHFPTEGIYIINKK